MPHAPLPSLSNLSRSNFPEYLLLATILFARLHNLAAMPLYWDEAYHVEHARNAVLHQVYFGAFPTGRWLNVMIMALFQPLGVEAPWIVRAPSVLLSLLTAAGCIWIGRWLGSRRVGRLAVLLYGLMPFAVFFDRQAMSDPIMATFGTLRLITAAQTARRQNVASSAATGMLIGLALLSKIGALFYFPVPFAAALLTSQTWRARWKAAWLACLAAAIAVAMFLAVYVAAIPETGRTSIFDPSGWCHSPQCEGKTDLSENAQYTASNVKAYFQIVDMMYTIPIWIAALGAIALARGDRLRRTLYLSIPAFLLVIPYLLTADWFPARYLTFSLAPVAVMAAFTVAELARWLARSIASQPLARFATLSLLLIVAAPAAGATANHLLSPFAIELAALDEHQYTIGWRDSLARQQVVADLLREQRITGQRINVLAWPTLNPIFYSNWGERLLDSPEQQAHIIPWLLSGDSIYVIQDLPIYPFPSDTPDGLVLEFVRTYNTRLDLTRSEVFDGAPILNLWRVVNTSSALTARIAHDVFGDPAAFAGDYAALASQLQTTPGAAVWLYPPNQFEILRAQNGMSAMSLHPIANGWPVDFDRVETEMSQRIAEAGEVWVVLWNAEKGDPSRRIESWASANMFRAEERWFGPIRALHFFTGAESGRPTSANVIFGDMAELSRVRLVESDLRSGGVLRVALTWRCLRAMGKSLSIFAHVFDGDGALVAQHDGIPQAGLAPTDSWVAGQEIDDLFAIVLPRDLPPGDYRIEVGMYDPATSERLNSADGLNSVEAAHFTVRP